MKRRWSRQVREWDRDNAAQTSMLVEDAVQAVQAAISRHFGLCSRRRRRFGYEIPSPAQLAGAGLTARIARWPRPPHDDALVAQRNDNDGVDRRPKARVIDLAASPLRRRVEAQRLFDTASLLDENEATADEAAALYERCLVLDPENALAHVNLGNLRLQRNQAEWLFMRAIAIDPYQPEANYNLAVVLAARCEFAVARRLLLRSIAADARPSAPWFALANCHEHLGKKAEALECWQTFVRIDPNSSYADEARKRIAALTTTTHRKQHT